MEEKKNEMKFEYETPSNDGKKQLDVDGILKLKRKIENEEIELKKVEKLIKNGKYINKYVEYLYDVDELHRQLNVYEGIKNDWVNRVWVVNGVLPVARWHAKFFKRRYSFGFVECGMFFVFIVFNMDFVGYVSCTCL